MSPLAMLATVSGIVLGLSGLPQATKIFRRKSARDVASSTYVLAQIGTVIWLLYALELQNLAVLVPNVLGLFTNSLILYGCYKYGKAKR